MATPNPTDSVPTTQGSILNVNTSNVAKLTSSNYLMWSRQIHALIDGYDLAAFLKETTPVPCQVITTDGVISPNPVYAVYQRQDKLLYSAILGAISQSVQPLLSKATTSAEIWTTLTAIYAKPSRGHIKQLQQQLKTWKKGTKTIIEYLQGITTRVDQLAHLGKVLDLEDQIESALDGLPEEYKQVADQIEGRDTPPTFIELHEKLINHEAKLLAAQPTQPYPVTANVATHRYRPPQSQKQTQRSWQPPSNSSDQRTPRPYLGRCQLCGVQGHSARRCSQLPQHNGLPTPKTWQPRANFAAASPWLLDSGATHHIASDLANLSLHQPYTGGEEVVVGNGSALPISHTGSTLLTSSTRPLHLNNILYVPSIQKNLISVYKLCNANQVSVQFYPSWFQVRDLRTGIPLFQGTTKNELYEWPIPKPVASTFFTSTNNLKTTISDWHSRLGHPSLPILKHIISAFSLPLSNSLSQVFPCTDCCINKAHKFPFTESTITSSRPLEILFSDVWTSPTLSLDNYKYYLIIVDHYSRYVWFYPLKLKSQVKETFIRFTALVENKFQHKIGTFFSDNGGEFIALRDFLSSKGITHLTSPPHTPEHNGLAERRHRHIVETGLTLLTKAKLPNSYWPFAFATAVYLINRMPTSNLSFQSPFKILFQTDPNYSKLKIFGCLCFPWLRPYTSNKLDPRSVPCVFLGYSLTQSAYLCWQPHTNRMYVSRHVRFEESIFPFQSLLQQNTTFTTENPTSSSPTATHVPLPVTPLISAHLAPSASMGSSSSDSAPTPLMPSPTTMSSSDSRESLSSATQSSASSQSPSQATHPNNSTEPEPNNNFSGPSPPGPTEHSTASAHSSSNTTSPTTTQPTNSHSSSDSPTTSVTASDDVFASPSPPPPPPLENAHQMQTRAKNNIRKPNTRYDLVPPTPNMNIIDNKWIFRLKYQPNGDIDKHKSRLVAKGFTQQPGIDYFETFSPVIKATTIRVVLDVATSRDWGLRQLDINNAFLQESLEEEVYMRQPPGFVDPDLPDYVCRLKKPIYGLKQAPRAWYLELKNHLLTLGFKNSVADTALFVLQKGTTLLYLLVYVDDIVVTGNDPAAIEATIKNLATRFSLKDMGALSYFLGIEVIRTKQGLHLNQRKYILDLLHRMHMSDAKPIATPMATNPKLVLSGEKHNNPTEYRQLVGSLQYLAFTRPDIAYAVNKLSQFMHSPTTDHWQAAKCVLRYLAGTPTHGIYFTKSNSLTLHAFSDADWGGDTDNYISTNGYIVYLGKHAISWSAKKQKGVARYQLRQSIALLLTPPQNLRGMKHLARDMVQTGQLRVSHVSTHDQLADGLTKPLGRACFALLRDKIGVSKGP
ncbi:unnamed protein product [Microthlaspi erraticum]|uniref:Integrase catalytic domain-containing protein n=1 Tax=Microthlaspi erraticum TaxID=1685480 RepID=A0A6D2IB08_9BRAS|nr:unnamed protein product [Microthlaspi erraticum]